MYIDIYKGMSHLLVTQVDWDGVRRGVVSARRQRERERGDEDALRARQRRRDEQRLVAGREARRRVGGQQGQGALHGLRNGNTISGRHTQHGFIAGRHTQNTHTTRVESYLRLVGACLTVCEREGGAAPRGRPGGPGRAAWPAGRGGGVTDTGEGG